MIRAATIFGLTTLVAACSLLKLDEHDESSTVSLRAYGRSWTDQTIAIRERYFTTEGDGMTWGRLERYLVDDQGKRIDLKDAFWALQKDGSYKRITQTPLDVVNTRLIARDDRLFVVLGDSHDRKRVTDCFAHRGDPATVKTFNKDYLVWGEFDPQQRRFVIDRFLPLNAFPVLSKKGYTGVELEQVEFARPLPLYCADPLDMTAVTKKYRQMVGELERLPDK